MKKSIDEALKASLSAHQILEQETKWKEVLIKAVDNSVSALQAGGKVLFAGNGGSAADAQHLAAELSGRFYYDRPPLASEALHCNTSYLTAVANDYSYDEIYARLLRGIGRRGDILVGLSTSGNSKNIVNAFAVARELGMATVAFTGQGGGAMKEQCDLWLPAPSSDTPRIQECHILMGHIFCQLIEARIYPRVN